MSMIRVVAASVAGLLVFSCNPETPKFGFKHREGRGKLEANGLRFVVMPDETTQLVEVDVRYDVGSREDPPGKSGLAHLVEHLMFQQRPDGPTSPPLMQVINDLTTFFNAYTNWDTTHYMQTARADNLDSMLKIESLRMFYGCQTISEEEFEREREVVRQEIRGAEGNAEGQIPQLVMSSIYPKGHAYERMIGGNDQQIASATLQDACEFMKKYYAPERATVIVAGGVDADMTKEAINKWFGKASISAFKQGIITTDPQRHGAPRVEVKQFVPSHGKKQFELDIDRPTVVISWVLPASNTPEGEAAGFGVWSAFFDVASKADDYQFAYDVSPQIFGGELAPVFAIAITLKDMNRLDEALEFARNAAKEAYRGFDEGSYDAIEESKNRRKASYIAQLEPLVARTNEIGKLVQFSKDFDFNSSDLYLYHQLDKIAKFDGARVGSAVKKALDWDKAVITVFKPNKEGIKGDVRSKVQFQTKSDTQMQLTEIDPREAKRPIKVAAELKSLANAQRLKLDNGMEVVLLPVKSMPLAAAQLMFKNAGQASTPGSPQLATAAAEFLHLPRDAEAFARTGINVGCRATVDSTVCFTHGVNIYLDVMLKGLERQIKAGTYEQDTIERWQKQVRNSFKLPSTQQETEYERQVFTALYGPDHPYTKTSLETPDAADKVHLDAVDSFRRDHFTAGNATLIVVGDFDPKYAEKLVKDTFGDWSKGTVDKPVEASPYKRTGPAFIGVVGKAEPMLTVSVVYPAPAGVDGQEGARQVLAEMLNQRSENIRFKLGSTYGLYITRSAHRGPSAYMMRGSAQLGGTIDAERVGESIKALRESFNALRAGDHFDEDFVRARRKILGKLLGESTVTAELAQRLGFIAQFGLDTNYYNTLLQQVAAASPAQIKALLKTELDPNNEVVVILGDKPHLDKAFKDAGITDVKIVEPEYK